MLMVVALIMVGRLGPDAIAGVGLANQIMQLLTVAFSGLAIGNTAMVARYVGASQKDEAEHAAKQALVIGAMIAVVIGIIGFTFSRYIITLLGGSAKVSDLGGSFLRVVSVGSIAMIMMFIGNGTLRGSGDTRTPMYVTGFINVINISLAYILIFGKFGVPAFGVRGAALAAITAQTVGASLVLWFLFRRGSVLKLPIRGAWWPRRDMVTKLMKIGGPAALEQTVFSLGMIVFSRIVVSLGTEDYAAQQIAFNVAFLSIMPAFAFSVAATTMVGQSLGAKNLERAEQSASRALRSGLIWMCLMGVVFFVFRHQLMQIYTKDAKVIQLGEMCLIFISLGQPFQAVWFVLGGALRGAGDTRTTMLIAIASIWGMRIAVGWLLGIVLGLGLFGVWLGWAADFLLRAILIALRYRSGKWKHIKV